MVNEARGCNLVCSSHGEEKEGMWNMGLTNGKGSCLYEKCMKVTLCNNTYSVFTCPHAGMCRG
jgi:hypothetical protein